MKIPYAIIELASSIYFTFHFVALSCVAIPRTTAFEYSLAAPFASYLHTAGSWQSWQMFISKADHVSIDGKIVATDEQGNTREFNPILPGFTENNFHVRYNLFWIRGIIYSKVYVQPYALRACKQLREKMSFNAREVKIVVQEKLVNTLEQVRTTGVIAHPKTTEYGPYPCASAAEAHA